VCIGRDVLLHAVELQTLFCCKLGVE
jgi:hypothetical protein